MSKIVIRETVVGVPAEGNAAASPSTRRLKASLNAKNESGGTKGTWRPKGDPYIWGIYWFLMVIAVIELFSASSTEITGSNVYAPLIRHGIFLALGTALVFAIQRMHYGYISRFAAILAIGSLGLLILTSFVGVEINGAQRAIRVAGFTIQPPEIVKLTVIIWLATILGRNQQPGGVSNKGVIQAAFIVVLFGAALWRNGLTNTILLMGVSMSMLLIGGVQWKKLGIVVAVYALCALALMGLKSINSGNEEFDSIATEQVAVTATADKGVDRSGTWTARVKRHIAGVSPDDPIDDLNRQVMMSNFAQANGGMFGCGPGNSRESARLPLAFSDYIYSIVIEDTGFIGGCALMLLYLFLLARAGRIAYKCSRAFPAFLILGCAVLIVFQALVHMAIVTGVFPVSGQPLPFISKGGTSVLVMSCAIGIMLSVSRYAVTSRKEKAKNLNEQLQLADDMQAANITSETL
ncbi:MAG: FtsW/RodA/SpoVE family cell cycle protein [Muribaculaceae bacterium]|nr:FtsW/RodA/SpoVE family cell cycle protein [Muribaculaceae bacterium]